MGSPSEDLFIFHVGQSRDPSFEPTTPVEAQGTGPTGSKACGLTS